MRGRRVVCWVVATAVAAVCIGFSSLGAWMPPSEVTPASGIDWSLAAERGLDVSANDALALQAGTLSSLGQTEVVRTTGRLGDGQVLAVVDTGITPSRALFTGPGGSLRLTKWFDLSAEGRSLVEEKSASDGSIQTSTGPAAISGIPQKSMTVFVGKVPEALARAAGLAKPPSFILVDSVVEGQFDGVLVDTDSDLDFRDEKLLMRFNESGSVESLAGPSGLQVSFLISDISKSRTSVTFGFDSAGHGTALAAVAAASGPGSWTGVAPGASIVAVKAVPSSGVANWADIVDGIRTAMNNGADVILVGSVPGSALSDPNWSQVQKTARDMGVQIVMPAGNSGPGIGTLTLSSDSDALLVVGGYYPGGGQVSGKVMAAQDLFYPYSSCGPDPAGNRGISLIAPAVAAVPDSARLAADEYLLMEGTSISSGYAAGALTLLRSVANVHSVPASAAKVARSLLEGARPLEGALPVEQGTGTIDLVSALSLARAGVPDPRLVISRKWDGTVDTGGVWLKGTGFGALPIWLDNYSPFVRRVDISTSADWLFSETSSTDLPAVGHQETWLRGTPGLQPGFYSSEVRVDDPEMPGVETRITVSATIPYKLVNGGQFPGVSAEIPVDLSGPFRPVRKFFEVPTSADGFSFRITGVPAGTRYFLYSPGGLLASSGQANGDTDVRMGLPESGSWQVCLVPITASGVGPGAAIRVGLEGVVVSDLGTTASGQQIEIVNQGSGGLVYRLSQPLSGEAWRYRHSGQTSTRHATTVIYPTVEEAGGAISLRLGTDNLSTLRGYLYKFDPAVSKWVQVAETATDSRGQGEIYYVDPAPGKYVAYIEGSGTGPQVFSEVDAMVIPKTQSLLTVPPQPADQSRAVPGRRFDRVNIMPATGAGSPMYFIVQSDTGGGVRGVVPQQGVRGSVPVVQVLGGPDSSNTRPEVGTLRAWTAQGNYALDLIITLGGMSYQLDRGQATALFEPAPSASWRQSGQPSDVIFDLYPMP